MRTETELATTAEPDGPRGAALSVIFLWILLFPYSDDAVEAVFDIIGSSNRTSMQWVALAVDVTLVAFTVPLKRSIASRSQRADGLWGSWTAGAVLIIGLHLVLASTSSAREQLSNHANLGLNLLASAGFVTALTLILLSTLGADPTTLVSRKRREAHPAEWTSAGAVLPLLLGTAAVYVTAALWYPVIAAPDQTCDELVSGEYFRQMGSVIPTLMLTLAFEFNYFRRATGRLEPVQWACPIVTVIMFCVGLTAAISKLVKAGHGDVCSLTAEWHTYLAFALTAQATAIGLATLVWLLLTAITTTSDED